MILYLAFHVQVDDKAIARNGSEPKEKVNDA